LKSLISSSHEKEKLKSEKIAKFQKILEAGHKSLMLKKNFLPLVGEPIRHHIRPAAYGGIMGGHQFTPPFFTYCWESTQPEHPHLGQVC